MQSYPLDLTTILYVLRRQSGRLQATLGRIPGIKEPCSISLVLTEGKITSCVLETEQGALIAEGERAIRRLSKLGVIDWLWAPGPEVPASLPDEPLANGIPFIPQRREPFRPEALAACSRTQRRVLGLVDGRRSIQEIATLLAVPTNEFERLLAVLQELQAMGLLSLE